ncbi:hypothetical protein [Peterkaempfera sp. SMS 1(5)a]|uniref:hypothetical protein n=1 Tax=Peterkaempfera podocarpi TaxID=3232308 RepID=UPI0036707285
MTALNKIACAAAALALGVLLLVAGTDAAHSATPQAQSITATCGANVACTDDMGWQ